ncbi:hypothetical protein DFH09DRAFT_1281388 [Mycena vulgaris]|nr:hypothetical protein DFH09DRAFT_1281388 [Mycena vulgaris]
MRKNPAFAPSLTSGMRNGGGLLKKEPKDKQAHAPIRTRTNRRARLREGIHPLGAAILDRGLGQWRPPGGFVKICVGCGGRGMTGVDGDIRMDREQEGDSGGRSGDGAHIREGAEFEARTGGQRVQEGIGDESVNGERTLSSAGHVRNGPGGIEEGALQQNGKGLRRWGAQDDGSVEASKEGQRAVFTASGMQTGTQRAAAFKFVLQGFARSDGSSQDALRVLLGVGAA